MVIFSFFSFITQTALFRKFIQEPPIQHNYTTGIKNQLVRLIVSLQNVLIFWDFELQLTKDGKCTKLPQKLVAHSRVDNYICVCKYLRFFNKQAVNVEFRR